MNEQPGDEEWLRRVRALQGEFRVPARYLLLVQLLTAVIIGIGAFILIKAWRLYQFTHGTGTLLFGAALGGAGVTLGFYQQRRVACGYVFDHGQVRFVSGTGRVLWAEDLSTLQRVEPGPARRGGPDTLTLHWAGRTRRIDLLDTLKAALAALPV